MGKSLSFRQGKEGLRKSLSFIGMLFGVGVMGYSGVVGVGIAAPVFLEATRKEKQLTSTILVLVGVFFYRVVILYGGLT